MFRWLTGNGKGGEHAGIPEIDAKTSIDELMALELVVLFKHSHACPVSWAAHSQVARFAAHHPSIAVFMIPVIKERAFSRAIAQRIGVEHESPQVIVLRRGAVEAVASHGEITEAELSRALQELSRFNPPVGEQAGARPAPFHDVSAEARAPDSESK